MPRLSPAHLEVRRLANAAVPEMIERLIEIARTGPNTAKLAAIAQLLDRALGKPETRVEMEQVDPQDEHARAFAAAVVKLHPELVEAVFAGKALPAVTQVVEAEPVPDPEGAP